MNLRRKTFLVTGGSGFLGSVIVSELVRKGVPRERILVPRSKTMDLTRWENCVRAVKDRDVVIHAAATEGGIGYNKSHPGTVLFNNSIMGIQLMEAARLAGVSKFVTIGTASSYPQSAPVPLSEGNLWDGYPTEVDAPYGLSKKILLAQGQAYRRQFSLNSIHLILANLYGPGDHFEAARSHILASVIRKIHLATTIRSPVVTLWGSGEASRDFIYVHDAAWGIVLATERYDQPQPANLASGLEVKISEIAVIIARLLGFSGKIEWDSTKPEGVRRRVLDVTRAEKEFGFRAKTTLASGIRKTIKWYLQSKAESSN